MEAGGTESDWRGGVLGTLRGYHGVDLLQVPLEEEIVKITTVNT